MLAWLWKRLSEGGPVVMVSGRALRRFSEREVDRLLRARVLIELRKADVWQVCVHCDCGLDARPIRREDGYFRACCPHDPTEDVVLTDDDLRRFAIDERGLVGAIAAAGGLGTSELISECLWHLGLLPSGRSLFLAVRASVIEANGALLAVKAAAGTAPISLIASDFSAVTRMRLKETGIEALRLEECLVSDGRGAPRLEIERVVSSATVPRLIVSISLQSAVLDNRRLDLPPQMFALFRMFAEQARLRDPVLRKEAVEANTSRPPREIVRDLRRALVASGLTEEVAKSLIKTVRGYGYQLGLAATEIAVEN